MCFSASASFLAGSVLSILGVATLRATRKKVDLAFAAIPLLFGIQQIVEGLLWLSFSIDIPDLTVGTTYLFSLFSHVLWPIYVPFAIGLLETEPWRRKVIFGFQLVGLVVGLYLFYILVKFPVTVQAAPNIVYVSPHFFQVPVMLLYLAATCVSGFFSSLRTARVFGALALLLFMLAYGLFTVALISVWCFFAAILSAIIYAHVRFGGPTSAKGVGGTV